CFLRSLQEDARVVKNGGSEVLLKEYTDITQRLAKDEPAVIGVLFATHARKKAAEKELRAHSVQFSSYHGRGFYDSMPVLLAINLARFFYNPQDNLALTGILRSPLCGVSDPQITKLILQNADLWQALLDVAADPELIPGDHELIVKIVEMLKAWLDAARILPFSDVLEKVWNKSWLSFYFRLENDGGQREENFHKLVDILRGAQRDKQYGMAEIIAFLQTLREKQAKEAEAELPDGGSVQLMTLHASKGLGFNMTILAQPDKAIRANSDKVHSGELGNPPQKYFSLKSLDAEDSKKETALWTMLKRDDAAREKAELKRQLYVACTRAKEHLVLLELERNKPNTWGSWLESARNEHVLRRFTYDELQQLKAQWPTEDRAEHTVEIAQVAEPLDGTKLPAELSVSQILDIIFPHAEKDIETMEENETPAIQFRAKERGSLIHRLLEWDGKSTFTAIQNLMRFNGLPESHTNAMQELAQKVRAELLELPFDHNNAKQEFAFILPAVTLRECLKCQKNEEQLEKWLEADDHWYNGIIDYLAPLQDGGYAILDFKTHWNPEAQYTEETRERIKTQLQIYAVAAKHLGFDAKKLYALRIYGDNGKVKPEEFDLPAGIA
ncbi:MAG: 3'-5' exonuclease, partial [Abditibacteriaceae bacterium]